MTRSHAALLRWIGALLLALLAFAARGEPMAVHAGMPWPVSLTDHAEVLEDADPALDFASVRTAGEHAAFQPLAGKPLRLEAPGVAWVRIPLRNADDAPLRLRLVLGNVRVERVDFYLVQGDAVTHGVVGASVPISQQRWPGREAAMELELAAGGEATVYGRVQHPAAIGLTPKLYSPAAYAERERRAGLWDGALFGGLMALGWSALIIFFFSRSRPFLWMALLCASICLFEATYRGYGQLYLWPEATDWSYRSARSIGLATSVLFATFVLSLARQEGIRLPGRGVVAGAAALQGLFAVWSAFDTDGFARSAGSYLSPAFYGLGLVMALILMRRTAPSAKLMVLVMSFALLNTALRRAEAIGIAPEFMTALGLDIHPNPVVALIGLATNLAVLAAWMHQVAVQRQAARARLEEWQREEQERLRAEVERQTHALNEALAYAEEKHRQKVQMLGYITHDLRAPLATIAGYTALLQESPADPGRHVKAIDRSVKYQLGLIDDLLEYTRAELQPLQVTPATADLAAMLDEVGDYAASLAGAQSNRFLLEAGTALPRLAEFDARRLRQVLLNLLSNAAKHTRCGTIRLVVGAYPAERGWRLCFAVSDTGRGIGPREQTTVFDAFRQIQAEQGGVGLGLFIAQRIVQGMGGTLTVQSTPGVGSTFSFDAQAGRVPCQMLAAGVLRDDRRPATRASAPELAGALPGRLRTELAVLARDGRLSDIEAWLSTNAAAWPAYEPWFREVEERLQELDLEGIEELALQTSQVPA